MRGQGGCGLNNAVVLWHERVSRPHIRHSGGRMMKITHGPSQRAEQDIPPIVWDQNIAEFQITIKGQVLREADDPNTIGVRLSFRPPRLYQVKLRPDDVEEWGPSIIIPITGFQLADLKPNTIYHCEVTEVTRQGEVVCIHTLDFLSPESTEISMISFDD